MSSTSLAQLVSKQPEDDPDPVTLLRASLVLKDNTYDVAISNSAAPEGCARRLSVEVAFRRPLRSASTDGFATDPPPAGNDGGPSLRVRQGSKLDVRPVLKPESPAIGAVERATSLMRLRSEEVEVTSDEPVELDVTPPGGQDSGPSLKLSFVA